MDDDLIGFSDAAQSVVLLWQTRSRSFGVVVSLSQRVMLAFWRPSATQMGIERGAKRDEVMSRDVIIWCNCSPRSSACRLQQEVASLGSPPGNAKIGVAAATPAHAFPDTGIQGLWAAASAGISADGLGTWSARQTDGPLRA